MSDTASAVPAPYVLDSSVLIAIARGDTRVMTLIQALDAKGRQLIVPALAVTAASLDINSEEAIDLLEGLELFENTMTAPLHDAQQAVRLAEVISATSLDPWDAHVAAIADAAICPILTLDAPRWRHHSDDLEESLHCIEIADPDET